MKVFGSLLRNLVVVVGTLVLMQFPLFMKSYELQLMGHKEEVEWHVGRMRETASSSGKNLDQYIRKFVENGDEDFARQGVAMRTMVSRAKSFRTALEALQKADIFMRPLLFVTHLDREIAWSTARSFQPGIPLTIEGATYASIGFILGTLLAAIGGRVFTLRRL